jgi:adenine-specific DNA-methyltransferase
MSNKKEKLEKLKELCDLFRANIKQYKSSKYDEANTRADFIDKFFKLLDWDVHNDQGFNETYREVVREDKVIIEGKPKAPDYSFRIGKERKFFLEAKKPSINIKEEVEPAFQVRRYGYTAKLPLSILTDFEEFAVYDTRIKPEKTDKASVARIFYCTYEDYEKQFEFIYETFSKNAILKGSFDTYIQENKNKKGTSEVDKDFLNLIEGWREALAKNIALRNKELDIYALNHSVQVILDRIIFLRIAEDKNMERYGLLGEIAKKENVYKNLDKLFLKANDKYNSGLFKPEKWLSDLDVDDKIINNIIKYLYYPDCPYELSVLPIEILGNIYEQFLGKTIRLTSSHQAKVEEKEEVRKAGGVYYTPQYIVDYIVQNTVGEKIKDIDLYTHPRLTILDPACGSGSFLVGAYSFLLERYLESYTDKKRLEKCLKNGLLYQVSENSYRLSITVKQSILLNHIFGVDIDHQAVEVTKLSLLLKLMEDENTESADRLFKHSDIKLLPDLSENIKCGNSLIKSDYYKNKNFDLFGKEELRKVNAFDWEQEFSEIFKKSGFDCVIGNPPYVYRNVLDKTYRDYLINNYKCAEGNFEYYKFFLEKSNSLLVKNGMVGMIVSASFLVQNSFKKLRQLLVSNYTIEKLCPLGPNVFDNATVDTTIIITKNIKVPKSHKIYIQNPSEPKNLIKTKASLIPQKRFIENDSFVFDYLLSESGALFLDKLFKNFPKIETGYDFGVGINTGYIKSELCSEKKIDSRYHPMVPGTGISRYGQVTTKGWIMYDSEFVKKKGKLGRTLPAEYLLKSEKILIVRTRNLSLKKRIIATIDKKANYNLNRLSNIVAKPNYSLYGLLGILNSSLFNWLYSTRFFDYEIKPIYLRNSPLADSNSPKLIKLVEQMLSSQEELFKSTNDSDKKLIQKKCDLLDKQIDEIVYQLYNLSVDEIEIVERSL